MASGFDDFMRKPFIIADIFECMAKHLDVKYRYETDQPSAAADKSFERSLELSVADLQELPAEWVNNLRQAALKGYSQQVLSLVEEIRKSHPRVADVFTSLVNDYQIDEILSLLDRY